MSASLLQDDVPVVGSSSLDSGKSHQSNQLEAFASLSSKSTVMGLSGDLETGSTSDNNHSGFSSRNLGSNEEFEGPAVVGASRSDSAVPGSDDGRSNSVAPRQINTSSIDCSSGTIVAKLGRFELSDS